MAKNRHTFAKRQREIEKKRKAEEKRARRRAKNQAPDAETDGSDEPATAAETDGSDEPATAAETDEVAKGTDETTAQARV